MHRSTIHRNTRHEEQINHSRRGGVTPDRLGCSAQEQPKVSTEPSRILIAYYSWGGNTKYAAAQIQKETGGTLFEIKPVKPYPADYRECTVQAKKEIQEGARPELSARVEDLGKYDVVFIGSPNWWEHDRPSRFLLFGGA